MKLRLCYLPRKELPHEIDEVKHEKDMKMLFCMWASDFVGKNKREIKEDEIEAFTYYFL